MRTLRTAEAVLLTAVLCIGMSAGPATADDTVPAPRTGTASTTATTSPAAPVTTSSATPSQPSSATPAAPADIASSASEPPSTSTQVELPDLTLTAWFDKPVYLGHEQITARVRVTNVGSAAVNQAMVTSTGSFSHHQWDPFHPSGRRVEPRQSVDGSLTGRATGHDPELRLVIAVRPLGDEQDANPADNEVTISVPITFVRGTYRGFVYGDSDGDQVVDPGEALAGVAVRVGDSQNNNMRTTTTGPDGRFVFSDLPGETYWTRFESPGWHFDGLTVVVDGTDDPDVVVRGVRVIAFDELTASLRFTQQDYRENDAARLLLTLTNSAASDFTDLAAECTSTTATDFGLGELERGVVVPAGTSRTFELTARIIAPARSLGHVSVECVVGAPPHRNGFVRTTALARVPGGMAPLVTGGVSVLRYKPPLGLPTGDGLPGVKVYLTDRVTGRIVARDVTGAGGGYEFHQVPAGIYRFGIVGPWRIVYSDSENFVVRDGENGQNHPWWEWYLKRTMFVEPGPDQPDPDPAPPAGAAPPLAETDSPPLAVTDSPPLAVTGADVAWLALGGLLTLVVGCALVLTAARRDT